MAFITLKFPPYDVKNNHKYKQHHDHIPTELVTTKVVCNMFGLLRNLIEDGKTTIELNRGNYLFFEKINALIEKGIDEITPEYFQYVINEWLSDHMLAYDCYELSNYLLLDDPRFITIMKMIMGRHLQNLNWEDYLKKFEIDEIVEYPNELDRHKIIHFFETQNHWDTESPEKIKNHLHQIMFIKYEQLLEMEQTIRIIENNTDKLKKIQQHIITQ